MNVKIGLAATLAFVFLAGCQEQAGTEPEMETTAEALESVAEPAVEAVMEVPAAAEPQFGAMTDERDGRVYKTVTIGEQTWFAENLATTQYKDGSEIPFGHEVDLASIAEEERIFYFNPGGDEANADTYGRLYSYAAAIKGICPAGWRVSTDIDWIIMEMELGMSANDALGHHFNRGRGAEVAPKLVATPDVWEGSFGTNESGFNALPAGYRTTGGNHPDYAFFAERAYFLTASRGPEGVWYDGYKPLDRAIRRNFEPGQVAINRDSNIPMGYGFSVRCVEGEFFPAETRQYVAPEAE